MNWNVIVNTINAHFWYRICKDFIDFTKNKLLAL